MRKYIRLSVISLKLVGGTKLGTYQGSRYYKCSNLFVLSKNKNVNDMITPNKKFFQWIYNRLVYVHKENPNVDYMISFKKRIDELTFDEPSWKPSEEQMDRLSSIVAALRKVYCYDMADFLASIYHNLKKLM